MRCGYQFVAQWPTASDTARTDQRRVGPPRDPGTSRGILRSEPHTRTQTAIAARERPTIGRSIAARGMPG